jgi:Uma2 family endonuclease
MTSFAPTPSVLSLEEFLRLPETKPASEYIDTYVLQKPMPQGKHSTLQARLVAAINQYGIARQTVYAFPELRCTCAGRSLVPDIAVFSWERIPRNEAGEIANAFTIHPDWMIEILSPDQSSVRVINNILFFLNQGTQLGWLIDPEERTVLVFRPNQQPLVIESVGELLPILPALAEWQLSMGELFAWLRF